MLRAREGLDALGGDVLEFHRRAWGGNKAHNLLTEEKEEREEGFTERNRKAKQERK